MPVVVIAPETRALWQDSRKQYSRLGQEAEE
jgi:hypothetical protein